MHPKLITILFLFISTNSICQHYHILSFEDSGNYNECKLQIPYSNSNRNSTFSDSTNTEIIFIKSKRNGVFEFDRGYITKILLNKSTTVYFESINRNYGEGNIIKIKNPDKRHVEFFNAACFDQKRIKDTIDVFSLINREYFKENYLFYIQDSSLYIGCVMSFDYPGWSDEEYYHYLKLKILDAYKVFENPPSYFILNSSNIECMYGLSSPMGGEKLNKEKSWGDIKILPQSDNLLLVDFDIHIQDPTHQHILIYKGSKKVVKNKFDF